MIRLYLLSSSLLATFFSGTLCNAIDTSLLYVKPGDLPPQHVIVDENVKCVECHPLKIKGIDGYTSATMTLKKSSLGVMPREDMEKRVVEVLQGKHGREIFVLSTSYNNRPLATIIEFAIDPKTLNLYGMSERQGEKLFHMNENNQVSLAYVRPAENYFRETLTEPAWRKSTPICIQRVCTGLFWSASIPPDTSSTIRLSWMIWLNILASYAPRT